MTITIRSLSIEEWKPLAEQAHLVVFSTLYPSEHQRFDGVLLATDEFDTMLAYVSFREFSYDVVYWQYGGAFPGIKGGIHSFNVYQEFLKTHFQKYRVVTTLIENTNVAMLKFAMKVGFRITGIRCVGESVLLEHTIEKNS